MHRHQRDSFLVQEVVKAQARHSCRGILDVALAAALHHEKQQRLGCVHRFGLIKVMETCRSCWSDYLQHDHFYGRRPPIPLKAHRPEVSFFLSATAPSPPASDSFSLAVTLPHDAIRTPSRVIDESSAERGQAAPLLGGGRCCPQNHSAPARRSAVAAPPHVRSVLPR
jgi:hypothetical protein